jgi:single-stranded-DNA-specific exonuclease
MKNKLPQQRWQIKAHHPGKIDEFIKVLGLSPIIAQVVLNRNIDTLEKALIYLNPERLELPLPLQEFPDLSKSLALLTEAIAEGKKIAICGDYDADGMTSTALLIRALRHLEADVNYAIPSRMKDGYGINIRIVEEFAAENVHLILTVDNGIAAHEPIARARALGIKVIITDHHDLPSQLPPADAILNPKLLPETSPYRNLAGVGVAYILAISLAQNLNKLLGLTKPLLELFTLGTIADLAPLVGVNRRWLKRGLKLLPQSNLTGIKALIQISGVNDAKKQLNPDDIGFRLGPRINAVGRLSDPQIVIDLLTTEDEGLALEKAMQCEQINAHRQKLCTEIQQEAIALINENPLQWQEDRVLFVLNKKWHHGVIGIVASRLLERYGVPVFIATYEEENEGIIRGSARGIEEFNIFEALEYSGDLLIKYGGHKAAGGFSLLAKNVDLFKQRLRKFAHNCLKIEHLKPLIKIDAQLNFKQVNFNLFRQIESLQPWGIENKLPVFWTPNVKVLEQRITNSGNHLQLVLNDRSNTLKGIAWFWSHYFPLPPLIDLAYQLKENEWNGEKTIQLEVIGARKFQSKLTQNEKIFNYQGREYICFFVKSSNQLKIKNDRGKELQVILGEKKGFLDNQVIDVTKIHYQTLIQQAIAILKG